MGPRLDVWAVCHQMYQTLNSGNGEPRCEKEAVRLYKSLIRASWATPTGEEKQLPELRRTQTLTVIPNGHPMTVSAWLVKNRVRSDASRMGHDGQTGGRRHRRHVQSSFTDKTWDISSPLA